MMNTKIFIVGDRKIFFRTDLMGHIKPITVVSVGKFYRFFFYMCVKECHHSRKCIYGVTLFAKTHVTSHLKAAFCSILGSQGSVKVAAWRS